jgi:hypothetical protein
MTTVDERATTGGINASQIYVAGTGNIYTAPADTPIPAASPPASPWVDHGYATEDGVEFTFGKTTDAIKGWQSFDTLRLITTEAPKSVKFSLMQSNASNLILALGGGTVDPVGPPPGIYHPPPSSQLQIVALFISANDGGEIWEFWCPRAILSDNVVFPWKKTGEAMYPLTFSIQAAATGDNFNFVFPTAFGTSMLEADEPATRKNERDKAGAAA